MPVDGCRGRVPSHRSRQAIACICGNIETSETQLSADLSVDSYRGHQFIFQKVHCSSGCIVNRRVLPNEFDLAPAFRTVMIRSARLSLLELPSRDRQYASFI